MNSEDASVRPIHGEPMRYHCTSASHPEHTYIVDLSENGGSGACHCPDFICRKQPNIKKGKPLFSHHVWCRHIRATREHFLNETLKAISSQLQ